MVAENLSPKLQRATDPAVWDGWTGAYLHWCPACKQRHPFFTNEMPAAWTGHRWKFDGNVEAPTFSPSMNISWGREGSEMFGRCHYILTSGVINFCGDCTHELKGQSVPLPNIPEGYR